MGAVIGTIAAVAGTVGAVSGGVKAAKSAFGGGRGDTTSQRTYMPQKSAQEMQLERDSMANYRRQQELAGQAEQNMQGADQMRDPAIQAYMDQISGEAFQATPQELQQIQTLRDAMIQQGSQGINQFVDQGLDQATSGAAARGLRGQAMGELRGRVLEQGAQQMGALQNSANTFAAQQAINNPFNRLQSQQGALQQGLTYGDMLRQNAMNNRQQLQNPVLMQSLANQRMAGRGVDEYTTTPSQGLFGGLAAGVGGLATGAKAGIDLFESGQKLGDMWGGNSTGNTQNNGGGNYSFNVGGGNFQSSLGTNPYAPIE